MSVPWRVERVKGEVDIVCLGDDQKPQSAVEVKWSDRPVTTKSELDHCVEFAAKNPMLTQPILVTTCTLTDQFAYKGIDFSFKPASVYAYSLGRGQ